jgi:hypothetical protein
MRTIKVYDVETGLSERGEDHGNWSRYRVMARTATEAIQKAKKLFHSCSEYERQVKEVCDTEQTR